MGENLEMFGFAGKKTISKCPHCGASTMMVLGGIICSVCDFRTYEKTFTKRDPGHAHARRSDPETSHEAASSISPNQLRESQKEVWSLFRRYGPMTDRDLVDRAEPAGVVQSPSGLRSRRAELVTMGKLRDSGKRTTYGTSARRHIVWEPA